MKSFLLFISSTFSFFLSLAQENLLEHLIIENKALFETVLAQPDQFEIQIVYTQINRDKDNTPHFETYTYQVDESKYFYPASTVKMPTAFMALEKLNEIKQGKEKNPPHKFSRMLTKAARYPQTVTDKDTTTQNGYPNVANYVRKIFLVSDNDAQNRLYEFCGQAYLNNQLRAKGFDNTRIIHRLGPGGFPFNYLDNQYTNPILFVSKHSNTDGLNPYLALKAKFPYYPYYQKEVFSKIDYDLNLNRELKGVAHIRGEQKIDAPFDFSRKNFISIVDLHDMLKAVIFPETLPAEKKFNLSDSDYSLLYEAMSQFPNESKFPKYDKPDNYCKFFIYGDKAEDFKIPKNTRIFNKVGWAYGYLTDVSYIVDFENKIEFFLTATIHVNKNQTYNDGEYEYEQIGLPFFANLGRVIYDFEKNRKKKYLPDLKKFRIEY